MTRINVGVHPNELCDQHLVAEYRELPRVFSYKDRVIDGPFRLGTGHVLWCSQFPGTMAARYRSLVSEMQYRGFVVNHPDPKGDGPLASEEAVALARPIVIERIQKRLASMDVPRWTKREPPSWAKNDIVS